MRLNCILLSSRLRCASPRVCLVCAEQDFAHHARVMGKLGRNLRADVSSGALAVVDALTTPFAWCADPGGSGQSRGKMGGVEAHTRRADASVFAAPFPTSAR